MPDYRSSLRKGQDATRVAFGGQVTDPNLKPPIEEQGMFDSIVNLISTGGAIPPAQVEAMRQVEATKRAEAERQAMLDEEAELQARRRY